MTVHCSAIATNKDGFVSHTGTDRNPCTGPARVLEHGVSLCLCLTLGPDPGSRNKVTLVRTDIRES
jgi:hypothetical protein